jgi:hypothetical protein
MPMHFFSQSDSIRWEESIEKNTKHITMSLLLQVMRYAEQLDDSKKANDNICLKSIVSTRGKSVAISNLRWG